MQCVDLGGRRIIKKKNFFQAEDGIRDVERSRGLGDVYKRQAKNEHRNLKYKHWNFAGSSNLKIGHLSTKKGRGQNASLLKTWDFDHFFLNNFLNVIFFL